jgi:hypothetical protein
VTAIIVFSLWLFFIRYSPYGNIGAIPEALGHAILMLALALLAMLAALRGKPWLMLAVFVLSLVPVFGYLVTAPGAFRWFGAVNALFLVSGLLMLKGRKERRR